MSQDYEVMLTDAAEHDLISIYDYIAQYDQPKKADYVLDNLESTFTQLATFPERGNHPPELSELGIFTYREVFFKPYRIIYRVIDKQVVIYLVVDGRRDMQAILERRLLS